MERIWSSELAAHTGQRVQLAGWLHRFRQLSQVSFLVLRDGKGLSQVVIDDPEQAHELARLPNETVLSVNGTAVAEPAAPSGVEVHAAAIDVISVPTDVPAFDLFRPAIKAQLPTILDHAAVALRHPRFRATHRIAAASAEGYRKTLRQRGFVEIFTPKLVASATEGGANVFPVDYFGRKAFLAQSPQFYKQIMVGVYERVFEIGPVFRAEPHDTPRHLNEFVSLDFEMGFIDGHATVMDMLSDVLRGMLDGVQEEAQEAIGLLQVSLPEVPSEIPAIHFVDAQQLITDSTGEDLTGEPDLAPAHERWLGDWARRTYNSDFLFVEGYPMAKRPFYTHPQPGRPGSSNSFDLLFRGLELTTGGQRLHRYADYLSALAERGLPTEPFTGYLEAFAFGMPPHGGCALSLERWVARLIGAANIRETALFPRDLSRLTP